jgi:uncharacterized membrane protein (DUF2068 family)
MAVDQDTSLTGLRAVAMFEAAKGGVVLLLGCMVLLLVHRDAEDVAESLLFHLHVNPDRHMAQVVLHAAANITDARLWALAAAAVSYASVRFVEAWGLWHRRVWAEWFALLSGGIYLPWEILKLIEHPDWKHWGVLLINIFILAYMLSIRVRACRKGGDCEPAEATAVSQRS